MYMIFSYLKVHLQRKMRQNFRYLIVNCNKYAYNVFKVTCTNELRILYTHIHTCNEMPQRRSLLDFTFDLYNNSSMKI